MLSIGALRESAGSGVARRVVAAGLIAAGLALAIGGAWIPAKAWLAQRLIERAWNAGASQGDRSAAGSRPVPWPWADTVPIARLSLPRQRRSMIVLEGDSGAVLAFGPGHLSASARPASGGHAVISAHRDTHFSVLRDLKTGDPVDVEADFAPVSGQPSAAGPPSRRTTRYRVVATTVVDSRDATAVAQALGDVDDDRLSLVTCWPLDGIEPGTPWRYLVTAAREPSTPPEASR